MSLPGQRPGRRGSFSGGGAGLPRNSLPAGLMALAMINCVLPVILRGIVRFLGGLDPLPLGSSANLILVIAAALVINGLNVVTFMHFRSWGVRVLSVVAVALNVAALVLAGTIAAFFAVPVVLAVVG